MPYSDSYQLLQLYPVLSNVSFMSTCSQRTVIPFPIVIWSLENTQMARSVLFLLCLQCLFQSVSPDFSDMRIWSGFSFARLPVTELKPRFFALDERPFITQPHSVLSFLDSFPVFLPLPLTPGSFNSSLISLPTPLTRTLTFLHNPHAFAHADLSARCSFSPSINLLLTLQNGLIKPAFEVFSNPVS